MICFLDIETIPTQNEQIEVDIRDNIKPPGNLKKQETIDKWWAENGDAASDDAYRKTALDGTRGEIFCISWAIDDGPTESVFRTITGDEAELLKIFYRKMADAGVNNLTQICGHYVKDFDLRFIFQRSVINRVEPSIPLRNDQRYGGYEIYDTMLAWAGWGNRISLKNLCLALGIDVKTGDIDGSTVWDAAQAGRYAEIVKYCEEDVNAVREVWKRLTFTEAF